MALKVMNRKSLAKLNIGLTVYIFSCDKFKSTNTSILSWTACLEKEDYEREKEDNISRGHGSFFHGG